MGIAQSFIVKNAIAGASDVVSRASTLDILGCVKQFPTVYYKTITGKPRILKSLIETLSIQTITYTAASNTTYEFIINQDILQNGSTSNYTISYTSDSTGSDAEIASALVTQINALGGIKVAATGSASPITLTAEAGYPLFTVSVISNVTVGSGMTTYAPSGTAANAITTVIAPDGTAATAIAGTSTVTVTTLAAHGLIPGNVVTIASVATMTLTYTDNVPFSATYGKTFTGAAGGTFRVATVPTSTTFTLDGVTGTGTNSGTITINSRDCAFLTTLGAETIVAGQTLAIAGVATMTIAPISQNVVGTAGSSGSFRVGAALTTTRFKIEGVNTNLSANTGTITITNVAQQSRGLGSVLFANGVTDAVTTNTYSQVTIDNGQISSGFLNTQISNSQEPTLYFNEGDADYGDFFYALRNALEGRSINVIANPNGYAATS